MEPRDPDLDLVRELSTGPADRRRRALGRLYERYHGRVFRVAFRVLGDWNRAHDVAQEVFLHLADRIASFRGESNLASWLYRVTVNRAIDARRRERRRPAWRMGTAPLEQAVRRPRGEPAITDPEEAVEEEARTAAVRQAMGGLSPKLRAILVLRYEEGLSYELLAEVLQCSMGTVKSRLNRAHTAMRQALEGLETPGLGESGETPGDAG